MFTYYVTSLMTFPVITEELATIDGDTGNTIDLLTKNTLTTLGVVTGAGTAVAAGALVTAALPAQMLTATAVSAGLIYAGDRQAKNLPFIPTFGKDAAPKDNAPAAVAPAEPVVQPAA